MNLVVNLQSVKIGGNENWLIFEGFVPQYDINKIYTFEFCGTELYSTVHDERIESELLERLVKIFKYAPYDDLYKIQKIFEKYHRFELVV